MLRAAGAATLHSWPALGDQPVSARQGRSASGLLLPPRSAIMRPCNKRTQLDLLSMLSNSALQQVCAYAAMVIASAAEQVSKDPQAQHEEAIKAGPPQPSGAARNSSGSSSSHEPAAAAQILPAPGAGLTQPGPSDQWAQAPHQQPVTVQSTGTLLSTREQDVIRASLLQGGGVTGLEPWLAGAALCSLPGAQPGTQAPGAAGGLSELERFDTDLPGLDAAWPQPHQTHTSAGLNAAEQLQWPGPSFATPAWPGSAAAGASSAAVHGARGLPGTSSSQQLHSLQHLLPHAQHAQPQPSGAPRQAPGVQQLQPTGGTYLPTLPQHHVQPQQQANSPHAQQLAYLLHVQLLQVWLSDLCCSVSRQLHQCQFAPGSAAVKVELSVASSKVTNAYHCESFVRDVQLSLMHAVAGTAPGAAAPGEPAPAAAAAANSSGPERAGLCAALRDLAVPTESRSGQAGCGCHAAAWTAGGQASLSS